MTCKHCRQLSDTHFEQSNTKSSKVCSVQAKACPFSTRMYKSVQIPYFSSLHSNMISNEIQMSAHFALCLHLTVLAISVVLIPHEDAKSVSCSQQCFIGWIVSRSPGVGTKLLQLSQAMCLQSPADHKSHSLPECIGSMIFNPHQPP